LDQLLHFMRVTICDEWDVPAMFGIKVKMIATKQRIFQILKISYMPDENSDDPATSMPRHVPYKQIMHARLEAELKIAEAYAEFYRRQKRMI